MLQSQLCKEQDFQSQWYADAFMKLKAEDALLSLVNNNMTDHATAPLSRLAYRFHRKLWEWCFIYEALRQRGALQPNKRGLGFGVGTEPLTAAFASHGCQITATDLDFEVAQAQGWVATNQHAVSLQELNGEHICDPAQFAKLVTFEYADMNHITPSYDGQFDFTWSSCSFEHLGSIELGTQFIVNQMKCLRPGGVAVHTTEFNLSSNEHTIDHNLTVLFRRRDIEQMVHRLRAEGYEIDVDFSLGIGPIESHVDVPPYSHHPHLRLQLGQFVTTSIALIIHRP
ncbi:SAM-dependent methyltransferase [Paenibacillus selenitireducens]|uniref:SAM-dependent methyltransferase n=1 Tax=Paenibacillus selenitireducens TaxID=1324314 RepID=A0A1T2XKE1_9BACL|nr:class I SAM-dependent methyltransferase [Paenibacillus selenitireducens]OPA80196.1 SAM-dependent methyltransferase [Paenibacillus selenitireducens]